MAVLPAEPPLLSPQVHAKLYPKSYLSAHLSHDPPTRPSARSPASTRPINIHCHSLTRPRGSAVVRIGNTSVVCGIRGGLLKAQDVVDCQYRRHKIDVSESNAKNKWDSNEEAQELAELGLLVPNIELATGCSPDHMPGGPPTLTAQALTQRLYSLLYTSRILQMNGLRIWSRPRSIQSDGSADDQAQVDDDDGISEPAEVKAFWVLSIDIWVISLDHGPHGLFDAAWLAMMAALQDTKLPVMQWDSDTGDITMDNSITELQSLNLIADIPVSTSFAIFNTTNETQIQKDPARTIAGGRYILTDPDSFEEKLCDEVATITIANDGNLIRMEKSGGEDIDMKSLKQMVKQADEHRRECLAALKGHT